MRESLAFFVTALFVAALVTPGVRWLARRSGAVDAPGGRRVHSTIIPRLGGVAILAGFFASLFAVSLTGFLATEFQAGTRWILGLALGSVVIAAVGLIDDVRGMKASSKLALQTLAAVVAFAFDYRIERVALPVLGTLDMGLLSLPVTVLWIVGIVNALNLIDGLDGLAAGVALCATITNFTVASVHENLLAMSLSAALGGAVLGFLLYNFNPATIFMGDTGSMFIGYALATTSLLGATMKSTTAVAILVPIIALGLPIMDTLFAIVRRFLEKRSLFAADRGHIHHRMLELGLTHRRAVLVLYGVSVALAASAIIVSFGRVWEVGAALLVVSAVLFGVIRSVGLFDYSWLRRTAAPRGVLLAFRRELPDVIHGLISGSTGPLDAFERVEKATDGAIRLRLVKPGTRSENTREIDVPIGPVDEPRARLVVTFVNSNFGQEARPLIELLAEVLERIPAARVGSPDPNESGGATAEDPASSALARPGHCSRPS